MNINPSTLFNPDLRIETVALDSGERCYVIDDALSDPDQVRQYAIDHRNEFVPTAPGGYPGISLAIPPQMGPGIRGFFAQHLRPRFDARRMMHALCRYAMVTVPANHLTPTQIICHGDVPAPDPAYSITASVLYLFADPTLGGTSFYEPVRSRTETARLFSDAQTLSSVEFGKKYGIAQDFMNDSNAYFKRVGQVAAKWNRMVFYDGKLLHSGDILKPERMTSDPATGRLTLNFFFSSRRNLAAPTNS